MPSAIFPSSNTYITPRAESAKIDTNNCRIILNRKISSLDKVVVDTSNLYISLEVSGNMKYNTPLTDISTTNDESGTLRELDITKYIVEKAKYDTLKLARSDNAADIGTGLYLQNTFYYQYQSNSIVLVNDEIRGVIGLWGVPVFNTLIQSAVYDLNKKTPTNLFVKGKYGYEVITDSDFTGALGATNNNIMSAKFRVYYTPLGESVNLETSKTNPQNTAHQFSIPYSQQQPIVDNVSFGREMQSVANRAGCEKRQIVRTFRRIDDYRSPHDHWYCREKDANGNFTGNIWRLTSTSLQIYSEHLFRVVETWSKNWSYRSENVPINREFRSWNIPADIVQRNLHWNDYCLIKRVKEGEEITLPDDALLSDWAKRQILSLRYHTGDEKTPTECTNLWFYQVSENGEKHGAVLNCSAFGFGNSLVFSGKTKDNLSAGVQRVKSNDGDNDYQFCKDVYYCDEDGKIDRMCIQVGAVMEVYRVADIADVPDKIRNAEKEALYMHPEFKVENYTEDGHDYVIPYNAPKEGSNLFKEDLDFRILKDPCEQLNFTYQLHLLTDDGYLVIGSSWATNCPLVKQRDGSEKLKVWKLKQYIPQGAQVMTTVYGDVSSGGITISSANNTITFAKIAETDQEHVGWCFTDENNNILLAFNDRNGATFKLHYTHFYKSITEALKKANKQNN